MLVGITSDIKKYYKTYVDILDHYWLNYFEKKKIDFVQFPNSIQLTNRILLKKKLNFDLIIFPGGCDINKKKINLKRIETEKRILRFAIAKKIPIVGICHGMQLINIFFHGKLSKLRGYMKREIKININEKSLFKKKVVKVKCYHNYGVKKDFLGKGLTIIADDKNDNVKIIKHKNKKIFGFMFHPEREKNYLKLDKIINFVLKT